ncbi:asparagine synthase-related protein [Verrucomicrobia bacterium]|nr:asparagine synthase-related protein [Verrucomicrobiota bacterium]
MSGGLDSNAILSCWDEINQKGQYNHHLFSLIPEKEHQTNPESRMLLHQRARLKGFPYHWITPSRALDLIGPAEMFVRELEDPFAVFSLSGTASCYREASDKGISSVVDGMDGDMTAGIPSMHWRFLLKKNQFMSSFVECIQHYRYEKESIHAGYVEITKMLLAHFLPVFPKWKKKLIGVVDGNHEKIDSWMREIPFRKDQNIADHLHHRIQQLRTNHHPIPPNTIEESILNGLKSPMLGVAIDRYRLSAESCNVKSIHPLLDRSLVEFLLQIPWNYRVSKGAPKALLRQHLVKSGYNSIANQRDLEHVGHRFTHAFMRDYFKRHAEPKADSLEALSKYINIKSYLKSYQQAVNVDSFENSDEDTWRIIMLSEWLVANPSFGKNQ